MKKVTVKVVKKTVKVVKKQRMVVVVGSAETARIERVTAESLGRMFCLF